jgi:hypothetical protein
MTPFFYLKINALNRKFFIRISMSLMALAVCFLSQAQMITGIWTGKIDGQKAEVKIIQNGDSLTGTSYYYQNASNYRRYSIKGYFDPNTNDAVWWDDQLIEEKTSRGSGPGKFALLSHADFNCPGGSKMMLDGSAGRPEDDNPGKVHLDKIETGIFPDEWDFVIENYTAGANDPWIIDSIGAIAFDNAPEPIPTPVLITPSRPVEEPVIAKKEIPVVVKEPKGVSPPATIEEKFVNRKKVLVKEIPVTGDSIELRFYDNAEIDGDSISLFLNDKLIFQHIRLLGSAYTIKLAVNDLQDSNELIMVAENLGSIPPNTSFMVAEVADKRYEARLESTEGSSAMIRFIKQKAASQ